MATHVALVRGWVQGIELSELAVRYLPALGDDDGSVDLRSAKGALMEVLDGLAAMARQMGIADAVTLRRQASRIRVVAGAPSLEDFAENLGDRDFYSESELIALYAQRHSRTQNKGERSEARRARLVARQLVLITDLSNHLTQPLSLADAIGTWFVEGTSERLCASGLSSIQDLMMAICADPSDWFEEMQGIGVGKAERIRRFLIAQRGDLGVCLSRAGIAVPQVLKKGTGQADTGHGFRELLRPASMACPALAGPLFDHTDGYAVFGASPAVATVLDNFVVQPSPLDGSHGRLRRTGGQAAITAVNDFDALNTWLQLKNSDSTQVLYRREIERLMMWCTRIRGVPLSSLSIEDALEYRFFLGAVPPSWVCKKGTPINSPAWSPFAGSLSASSTKKALVIVHGFFAWLVTSGYCTANPFSGVKVQTALPSLAELSTSADDLTSLEFARSRVGAVVTRTLPHAARLAIERELAQGVQNPFMARVRFVFRLAVMTGLRISEIAAARRDHLVRIEPTAQDPGGWSLRVVGKRGKLREVPFADSLMQDLLDYLGSRGLPACLVEVDAGVFLVGKRSRFLKGGDAADGVRPQTIHRSLLTLFERSMQRLSIDDRDAAARLQSASAHWLRHTCATDAVAAEVPLDVVANTLGHSSLTTTSQYVHTEQRRKLREMRRYWDSTVSLA